MKKEDLPVIEMTVLEDGFEEAIISFVEKPAVKMEFMYFSEEEGVQEMKFQVSNEDQRLVTGVAMIPNQKILRKDKNDKPFYVFFNEDSVKKASELYLKNANHKAANIEHVETIGNVTVVESWIVEDPKLDKAVALGFSDLVKGMWFVTYKIDNDEVWSRVKKGEVLGFSIQGKFKKAKDNIEQGKDIVMSKLSEEEKIEQLKEIFKQK